MKTALVVSKGFPPDRHSGTIRVESLCRHLPSYGFQVIVVTAKRTATGSATGLNQPPSDSTGTPLTVLRVDWSSNPHFLHGRAATLPIVQSGFVRGRRRRIARDALNAVNTLPPTMRPDVVFATCPPGDALITGAALSHHFRVPLVADYRDPWSFWPMPTYAHYLDFMLERHAERNIVRQCKRIIVTTQASRTLLCAEFDAEANKVHVVPNGYVEDEFAHARPLLHPRPDAFTIVYTGELANAVHESPALRLGRRLGFKYDPLHTNYNARSLKFFLAGLCQLLTRQPSLRSKIRLCIVGWRGKPVDHAVENFPYPEVIELYPRVSPEEAAGACLQAHLLLLLQLETFHRGRAFCVAIPGKLYSYLRSGKRILACAQESEISVLLESFDAGTVVDAQDATGMSRALEREVQRWTMPDKWLNERRIGIERFERRQIAAQVADVLGLACS